MFHYGLLFLPQRLCCGLRPSVCPSVTLFCHEAHDTIRYNRV